MEYYNNDAMFLATEICKVLKDNPVSQGAKLVEMHKAMMRFNDIVIDCASRLAPYQSSKLQSIEIKKHVEHRFVIQAPAVTQRKEEWLDQVQLTALPPPIAPVIKKSEIITDTDDPDYEYLNNIEEAQVNGT